MHHQQTWVNILPTSARRRPLYAYFTDLSASLPTYIFAVFYGAVMIRFLSGIYWAICLFFFEKSPPNLFITSSLTGEIPWISSPVYPARLVFLLQTRPFLHLLWRDLALERACVFLQWPHNLRGNTTTAVGLVVSVIVVS